MSEDQTQRGILLFVAATLLFASMDVVAKWLIERYDPLLVVWARYNSQLFWTLVVLAPRLRVLLRTRHIGLQLLRSAFLFCATAFFFLALEHLLLAETVAIFEIAPLAITGLSVLILREQVGVRRWVGVGVGLIGALIIIRPGSGVFQPAAVLPLGAATCFAAYTITTRILGRDEPPETSFLYTTLIGSVAAFAFLPFAWQTPTATDAAAMATFGIIGGVGHFLLILAFTATQASILAPFSYLGLLWAALYGYFVFAEMPDSATWIGAGVVVGAGIYVWYREQRASA